MKYNTNIQDFKIRFAEKDDVALILKFIKELADYEKLLAQVVATENVLYESLFIKKEAEVIIGEYEGEEIGFALFFQNFSTFIGKAGLYLEDLYIKLEVRGKGLGKEMLSFLAKLAKDRDCKRFEWWCLDWNKSSINFYKSIGAKPMKNWTVYRLSGDNLDNLAKNNK
ncbi:GNAT family N-acetyltransferase [Halanaerobium sp.]|uniref:GNAT family N-acetyltransferase n=1 Tax=Halanaerobium sp. TaxID=1895664 RepID=UPI000DE5F4EC|nr:GNAT family N-acetyltransferase [Halanaerobium sp.]PUU86987.1 MAG: N-acetyltransferase GCN5 [Halanaerobium sp.]